MFRVSAGRTKVYVQVITRSRNSALRCAVKRHVSVARHRQTYLGDKDQALPSAVRSNRLFHPCSLGSCECVAISVTRWEANASINKLSDLGLLVLRWGSMELMGSIPLDLHFNGLR